MNQPVTDKDRFVNLENAKSQRYNVILITRLNFQVWLSTLHPLVAVNEHVCSLNVNQYVSLKLHADVEVHKSWAVSVKTNLFWEVMMAALMSCAALVGGQQYCCQENSSWKYSNIKIEKLNSDRKCFTDFCLQMVADSLTERGIRIQLRMRLSHGMKQKQDLIRCLCKHAWMKTICCGQRNIMQKHEPHGD